MKDPRRQRSAEYGMTDAEIVMDFLEWLAAEADGIGGMGLACEGQPEPYLPTDAEDLEVLEGLINKWTEQD